MRALRIPLRLPGFRRGLAFGRDRRGVSGVEFALILPIMVVLYFSGFEITEAVTINRKVTHTTSVLGDLVAQGRTISSSEMSNILDAAMSVMNPYPTTDATLLVTGVTVDSQGSASVAWSCGRNTAALATGGAITIPDDLAIADTFLVMSEVHYEYRPTFGYILTGTFDFNDTFYLWPRLQNEVTVTSC